MAIMNDFKQRRENILGVFNQAKSDLETLNTDIQNKIEANQQQIAALSSQNSELAALKSSNESSIKTFSKFFK